MSLIARATALLPAVSEERRARFRELLARLRSGTHGVGVGADFSAAVDRIHEA